MSVFMYIFYVSFFNYILSIHYFITSSLIGVPCHGSRCGTDRSCCMYHLLREWSKHIGEWDSCNVQFVMSLFHMVYLVGMFVIGSCANIFFWFSNYYLYRADPNNYW